MWPNDGLARTGTSTRVAGEEAVEGEQVSEKNQKLKNKNFLQQFCI